MNKFEEHWRNKMDDPGEQAGFLNGKVRAGMWEKILTTKNGFERNWQSKAGDPDAWIGTSTKAEQQALWDKLQISITPLEQQWRKKIDSSQENGCSLDEAAKKRIATTVFTQKENFESGWRDKMNDPLRIQDRLDADSKNRIWHNIQSGNSVTTDTAPGKKRKSLFVLRWSHAAALLIGAFSTWLIWDKSSAPLQNELVATPRNAVIPTVAKAVALSKNIMPTAQTVAQEPGFKPAVKEKPIAISGENRALIAPVAGKATPVKTLQSTQVKVTPGVLTGTANVTTPGTKAVTAMQEPEIEVAITQSPPVKKVVHISDIRPAEAPAKGTAIYGRAFGDGKEKRNEKSTMTFNSVLKNYK